MKDAAYLIQALNLLPHPEGGFYRQTYKSELAITLHGNRKRHAGTAIYYLLSEQDFSALHRIQSDELWLFHQGEPLEIIIFNSNNEVQAIILGNDIEAGEQPQAMIPAHTWFGARIKSRKGYSLVSCTVSPGFDFADFELANRNELINQFPQHKGVVEAFTRL